jgi:rubrerythrin
MPQTAENGAKDKAYNLVWYVEECLKHDQRLQAFADDAERDGDSELAEFFRQARKETHSVGEQAKKLLGQRLIAA